ncbi:MBL fold metallo-hydrolase [Hydrogenophaga crassostreae]|uniref:MBL fold metallo-hydrolase n=2 Tax=Hydrogenophaga crassostreae TaxID=1763535 RepID=A0A162YRV4_9BURK|nr:MBL fold metallo-hydrolase [Hydrogenophaga crassostreae]OAD39722.1 MBL fold metallo-hydrolase [Hydrogenophaga crassostreae]
MQLEQVGPHSYYVQGQSALGSPQNQNFISNAGFVITPESVVVIDALGSPALAERLTAEIRKLTPLPISHVILTHYHADHIYGLQFFKALGAHITAHGSAKEYIQSDTARLRLEASRTDLAPWIDEKTRLVEADTWISGPTVLKIGGMVFEIDHVGPSHTPEDLTIFVPSEKVLFAGDLFFNGRLPFVGKANSSQWIKSLELMLAHDANTVVPGHGAASTDPKKDIGVTRDYLKFLRSAMGQAVQDFVPFEEAYKDTDWGAFSAIPMFGFANRMNAYNTYLLMEEEALEKKR